MLTPRNQPGVDKALILQFFDKKATQERHLSCLTNPNPGLNGDAGNLPRGLGDPAKQELESTPVSRTKSDRPVRRANFRED